MLNVLLVPSSSSRRWASQITSLPFSDADLAPDVPICVLPEPVGRLQRQPPGGCGTRHGRALRRSVWNGQSSVTQGHHRPAWAYAPCNTISQDAAWLATMSPRPDTSGPCRSDTPKPNEASAPQVSQRWRNTIPPPSSDLLQACGHQSIRAVRPRPKLEPVTAPPVIVRIASATSAPGITPVSHWQTLGAWTGVPRMAESRDGHLLLGDASRPSATRPMSSGPDMLDDVFEVVVGLRLGIIL